MTTKANGGIASKLTRLETVVDNLAQQVSRMGELWEHTNKEHRIEIQSIRQWQHELKESQLEAPQKALRNWASIVLAGFIAVSSAATAFLNSNLSAIQTTINEKVNRIDGTVSDAKSANRKLFDMFHAHSNSDGHPIVSERVMSVINRIARIEERAREDEKDAKKNIAKGLESATARLREEMKLSNDAVAERLREAHAKIDLIRREQKRRTGPVHAEAARTDARLKAVERFMFSSGMFAKFKPAN